jgi:hypothetical protein
MTIYLAKGGLFVGGASSGGGGGGDGDGFPLIPATSGPPTLNHWAILDTAAFTFPTSAPHETRIGLVTTVPDTVITVEGVDQAVFYNGNVYPSGSSFTIGGAVYLEWSYITADAGATGVWVQRGSGNEAVSSGGGASGGWLEPASGSDMQDGKWVEASNNTLSSFPSDATEGMHVGLWVDNEAGGGGSTVSSSTNSFYVDRNGFEVGEVSPLRGGAWYEWVARDFGEDIRWIPVSGSANAAKPPLEYAEPPFVDPASPNMWVLASNDSAINFPESPQHGDVFGIFADVSCTATPANGNDLQAPDLSSTVSWPDNISLTIGTYYEWIYISTTNTWHPRQNQLMNNSGGGSGALPIIPGDVGTPTLNTWALFPGGTFTFPELVPFESQIGLFSLAATTLTAPTGRQFLYNGVLYEGPASVAIPAYVYCEWSYLQSPFNDTTVWVPRGASNESVATGGPVAPAVVKSPVRAVSIINLTLSGLQTVDGVSLLAADRVLVVGQSSSPSNGIYDVSSGAWTRATDADTSAKVFANIVVPVSEGTTYADTAWTLSTNNPITLDTTSLVFSQSGGLRSLTTPFAVGATNVASAGISSNWAPADHRHAVQGPWKDTVRVVATTNLGLTGLVTVDGVALVLNDRVLAVGQSTASQNGIWVASTTGWNRAGDADAGNKLVTGSMVPVSEGTTYADTMWMLSTNGAIVIASTNLSFVLLMRGTVAPSIVQASQAAAIGTSPKFATNDHIHAMEAPYNGMSGFRLSNNAASPIPVSGSSSTIYIVPYDGYRISLYNGSIWVNVTLSSVLSQVVSGLAVGVPVDVFLAYTSLTNATIVQVNWANATTRATTLSLLSGVYVSSASTTQRYIGTYLPDGTASYSHLPGGSAICGIWNQNNRIKTSFQRLALFGSAVPGTPGIWAPPGGMGAPHIQLLNPQLDGDEYSASAVAAVTTTGGAVAGVGIGFDSTSSVQGIRGGSSGSGSSTSQTLTARAATRPASIGVRTVNMLLYVTATGPDFVGNTDPIQSGIIAEHWH